MPRLGLTGRPVNIIGGGIAGLSAAYYLRQLCPSQPIAVLEASDRVGGRLETERSNGYLVEAGPDGFVTHKPAALHFCQALGLGDHLIHPRDDLGPAYVRRDKILYRLPEGLSGLVPAQLGPLFRNRLLSVRGRLRVAMELFVPRRRNEADESLEAFLTRRFGQEAASLLFEPLFAGIYGRIDALSARVAVPQLVRLEEARGSVLRGIRADRGNQSGPTKLASLAEGMGSLPARAQSVLNKLGVRIECGVVVRAVEDKSDRLVVVVGDDGQGPREAGGVIVALPSQSAAEILGNVAPGAAAIIRTIASTSSAVVTLGFSLAQVDRPLDASGYVVAGHNASPVTACTWTSAKFSGRAPPGHHLLRVFTGGARFEPRVDDGDLVAVALDEVGEALGIRGAPDLIRIHRHNQATPCLAVGHHERTIEVDRLLAECAWPVLVAGNYQTGVGVADAVAAGRAAAIRLADRLTG